MMRAVGDPKAGDRIGARWVLESPLGRGGFGSVWIANDPGPPVRRAALKILHAELARDPRIHERFTREARVLAALDHPHIARSFDFGTDAIPPYIAMELVAGVTLKEEIAARARAEAPYSPEEVISRLSMIAAAVDYAHAEGVIHRDLKPGNVMVGGGSLKVLDFGVAKIAADRAGDATTAGRIVGSLLYLSPEQIRGEEPDPRADVFSIGAIAFELLTLRRAWSRDWEDRPLLSGRPSRELEALNSQPAVMQRILAGVRPKVSPFRAGVDPAVDEVIARALAIDRAARFASAGELCRALEAAFAGRTFVEEPAAPPAPPRASWTLRALIALSILAPLAAITLLFSTTPPKEAPREPAAIVPPSAVQAPTARALPPPEEEIETAPKPKPSPPARVEEAQQPAPPPAPRSELDVLLEALREKPDDLATAEELSRRIALAADRIADPERRLSIKRCAAASLFPLDVRELERCRRELASSLD